MLLSMTGYGEAHRQRDGVSVGVEVRTINNRYFKMSFKCDETYNALEGEVESLVRKQIKRGTVQVALRVDRAHGADDYQLNTTVLDGYRRQILALAGDWGAEPPRWETLLLLPGVVDETSRDAGQAQADWPLVSETLSAALTGLEQMRRDEGQAMDADLRQQTSQIAARLATVDSRAALVSQSYRTRLEERLKKTLAEFQVTLTPSDLIKEVSIFAERSDISEEIVRLRSHLDQFAAFLEEPESSGRKLEFLTQEMFRETNTIGSKANDVEISREVIEIKAAIERIREMIQNVE